MIGRVTAIWIVLLGVLGHPAWAFDPRWPVDAGLIDLTKPPYNARGDGGTDNTQTLRRALADYTGSRRPVYLPRGVYLVSDTLEWPGCDRSGQPVYGFANIQGDGPDATVIRLKDGTFRNPANPRAVLSSGPHGSADWFACYTSDLTIDVGTGNDGAIGLRFFSNNTGAVRRVDVKSGDGRGLMGLQLGYNDMNGPLLVQDLRVRGFRVGVHAAASVNSQTLERIELSGQSECGLKDDGQTLSVRGLRSENAVPAMVLNGGFVTVIDAELVGRAGASNVAAIETKTILYARGIRTRGYSRAIEDLAETKRHAAGPNVAEYLSDPPTRISGRDEKVDLLPVRETPEPPVDDPRKWANVVKFGASAEARGDSSEAIQRAIDSGATTVYFPTGFYNISRPIEVRGQVARIVGFGSWIDYFHKVKPTFRIVEGSAPEVTIEGFFPLGGGLEHESKRTLILKDCELRGYRGTGRGAVHIENCVSGPWEFDHQRVWARQLNAENKGTHVLNKGGRLWVLGYKTERGGTLIETTDGGRTQVDGGFSYTTEAGALAPMFVVRDASLVASFTEICYSGDPFRVLLEETRMGRTLSLPRTDPRWRGRFVRLLSEGPEDARPESR